MTSPKVAQIALYDGGASYAIILPDQSFIMIDGGMAGNDYDYNRRRLDEFFAEYAPTDKAVVIEAWIITHFHCDHVDLAARYLKESRHRLTVRSFIYNHPGHSVALRESAQEQAWEEAMELYPTAQRRLLKRGEIMSWRGVEAYAILTEADMPSKTGGQNSISAAIRFKFDTGTVFLCLGDCMGDRLARLIDSDSPLWLPRNQIKCDLLSVAHHGFTDDSDECIGGCESFYRAADPSVCLFSMNEYDFLNDRRVNSQRFSDNWYLLHSGKRCYHHAETTVIDSRTLEKL